MVDHVILLRGLGIPAGGRAPTILQRIDQDFIFATLDELATEKDFGSIVRSVANNRDEAGVLKLFQPIQRTFHLVVLEAACDIFGEPRLDVEQIVDAGLVVRRIVNNQAGHELHPEVLEGWMQAQKSFNGWVRFNSHTEEILDPDPQFRPPSPSAGNPEVNRRLRILLGESEPLTESVERLYVAPPYVSAATGKTILYGIVPVTSSEYSEATIQLPNIAFNQLQNHVPSYLKAGPSRDLPRAGETLTLASAQQSSVKPFVQVLQQLAVEFDAFGESVEAQSLFQALNEIELDLEDGSTQLAGDFLKHAAEVMLGMQDAEQRYTATVNMPISWPAISEQHSERITHLVRDSIKATRATFLSGRGRFDEVRRKYRLRAFVRVRRHEGCPPKTFWSEYSEPYTIAPWYESGDAPPVLVTLPDPTDLGFLKKLKPNVAFSMPESLFNFIRDNDAASMLDGDVQHGGIEVGLDWICGFNIPIITFCAFVVLNIILQLLNIVFWWLPFVKICIPFPRSE